ncbi:uncharacterized protein LOC141750407 isoform X1 [Larus michahellis]|uniref:uncharacterized protein LOC141750407 isoform X1 n=1 Tax=Larus michahellis TaxID=119627 RepID=UPI003D9B9672
MAAPGPASLQRRLQSSQEARHRQAVLVRKLQAKVLQYRTRCRELEQQLEAGAGCLPGRWEGTEALEKALLEVKEEQQRCEDLAEANSLLREHLEKAKEVNSALKEDVGKLTVDWMRAREELEAKEREWRQERELYENYFRGDRDRLLGLWHQMVTFRRHFLEMKTATNRDLSELKAEQTRLSGSVMANCSRLNCSVMSFQAKGELEKKELQDRLKDLVALEDKHCVLQHELVVAREALEESHLERDVLKEEKRELRVALEKLEQENEALLCKVDETERAKISAQEKLSLCERTKSELCAEKGHLEQLLKKAEEQQEELRVELGVLAEEKEEAQEKLLEVSRQQESSRSGLEQLRQESSRQGHALAEVCAEKELLVREKAALEVRLAAMERERQGLSEQLAEARSGKETLECSLLEAQQHLSELEISRSHLETQLHAVAQAKEVIQGEVKCLQWELEAERSLLKRERQNMAQALLQKEQQHTDTLKVREADHQGEINKLLQDVQAIAEGQRLSWLSEKRLLSQRLERLQRAVARLDREKTELKQYSAELRRTLEEVERERRRLRRYCRGRALPDAGGSSLSESDQHKMLASQQVSLPQTQLAQDGK